MSFGQPTGADLEMMQLAVSEARAGLEAGGVPVGAVLASGGQVLALGRNERVQRGDPVAHGEIACLRNAGGRPSYRDTTLYTTLSPCPMCSGAILLFRIPRVIVGEAESFAGDLGFLTGRRGGGRGGGRGGVLGGRPPELAQLEAPVLAHEVVTEAVVPLLLHEDEPGPLVDAPRGDQDVVGPQHHLGVPGGAGERDALTDQALADAHPARP